MGKMKLQGACSNCIFNFCEILTTRHENVGNMFRFIPRFASRIAYLVDGAEIWKRKRKGSNCEDRNFGLLHQFNHVDLGKRIKAGLNR